MLGDMAISSYNSIIGLMAYWYTGSAFHQIPQSYLNVIAAANTVCISVVSSLLYWHYAWLPMVIGLTLDPQCMESPGLYLIRYHALVVQINSILCHHLPAGL